MHHVPPRIYAYMDYRSYVRDWLGSAAAVQPHVNQSWLSKKMGCSESLLRAVLNGATNLSPERLERLADALDLSARDAQYFGVMATQNQEPDDSGTLESMLRQMQRDQGIWAASGPGDGLFSGWHVLPILELFDSDQAQEDPAWIARTMRGQVSEVQASLALDMLKKQGHLVRDANNRLRRTERELRTGSEVFEAQYLRYVQDLLAHVKRAIATGNARQRGVLVWMDDQEFAALRARTVAVYEELMAFMSNASKSASDGPRVIVQIGLGYAALTQPVEPVEAAPAKTPSRT